MLTYIRNKMLLRRVQRIVAQYGGTVTGLGPNSVGVQGDARVEGPVVFVRFPEEVDIHTIGEAATQVVNKVPRVTRVLQETL